MGNSKCISSIRLIMGDVFSCDLESGHLGLHTHSGNVVDSNGNTKLFSISWVNPDTAVRVAEAEHSRTAFNWTPIPAVN